MENLNLIMEHNRKASLGEHSYFLKMNQFGDMVKSISFKSYFYRLMLKYCRLSKNLKQNLLD